MELDALLASSLMLGASEALDRIGLELAELHDAWLDDGVDSPAVPWLEAVITELGWWSGRLAAESN